VVADDVSYLRIDAILRTAFSPFVDGVSGGIEKMML
jgi:hypothetical protein